MNDYVTVEIRPSSDLIRDAVMALTAFGTGELGWRLAKSVDVESILEQREAMLIDNDTVDGIPAAGIAFWVKESSPGRKILYSANVVPREMGQLTRQQYNAFALRFAGDLRVFLRHRKSKLRVSVSPEEIGLAQIIKGRTSRRLFERYLSHYPTSFHPSDVERLDAFICAVNRYSTEINPHEIAQFLVEDLKWDLEKAKWVHDRIETGLEILAVNRRLGRFL